MQLLFCDVIACVLHNVMLATLGMTMQAASRDRSTYLATSRCFTPDHVTLRGSSARFVTKYFNGLPIPQPAGFSRSFRRYMFTVPREAVFMFALEVTSVLGFFSLSVCSPYHELGRISTFVLRLFLIICHYGTMPCIPCKSEIV